MRAADGSGTAWVRGVAGHAALTYDGIPRAPGWFAGASTGLRRSLDHVTDNIPVGVARRPTNQPSDRTRVIGDESPAGRYCSLSCILI